MGITKLRSFTGGSMFQLQHHINLAQLNVLLTIQHPGNIVSKVTLSAGTNNLSTHKPTSETINCAVNDAASPKHTPLTIIWN